MASRWGSIISVDYEVHIDEVISEIKDDELLREMKKRGLETTSKNSELSELTQHPGFAIEEFAKKFITWSDSDVQRLINALKENRNLL